MPNDNEIKNAVMQCIKKYNIKNGDFSKLSDKLTEQLILFESYIQGFLEKQKELKSERKKYGKLTLLNAVEGAGLPRSTVYYNKDTLKIYIEERLKEVEKEDVLNISKMAKLQEDFEELKSYLQKFQKNLVENQFLEMKIKELENELAQVNVINETMALDLSKKTQENEKLKFELQKNKKRNIAAIEGRKNG